MKLLIEPPSAINSDYKQDRGTENRVTYGEKRPPQIRTVIAIIFAHALHYKPWDRRHPAAFKHLPW